MDAPCVAPSRVTQKIFAVLVEWHHHIVLTMIFKLVSFLHLSIITMNERGPSLEPWGILPHSIFQQETWLPTPIRWHRWKRYDAGSELMLSSTIHINNTVFKASKNSKWPYPNCPTTIAPFLYDSNPPNFVFITRRTVLLWSTFLIVQLHFFWYIFLNLLFSWQSWRAV